MKYFWSQQFDLPKGVGYARFGPEHIAQLLLVAAGIILANLLLKRKSIEAQERFIRIFPWIMVGMETFKDLYLVRIGRFSTGYLPLHLCSLGMFVFLIYSFCHSERWRAVFSEVSVCLILPGSAAALLFPDWIALYPVLNFMNIYSYIWHMNLILFPVFLLVTGRAHPTIRHIHWCLLFLAAVSIPIYIFDRIADTNYLFINWPLAGSPIESIYNHMGKWWRIGYAILVVIVVAAVYCVLAAAKYILRVFSARRRGRS